MSSAASVVVATTISNGVVAARTRSIMRVSNGAPARSRAIFFGSLDEPIRAWTTTAIFKEPLPASAHSLATTQALDRSLRIH